MAKIKITLYINKSTLHQNKLEKKYKINIIYPGG